MHIPRYIAATLWRVQLTCNCRAVSEDRPEADLLATVTVLSLIGHVVAEKAQIARRAACVSFARSSRRQVTRSR